MFKCKILFDPEIEVLCTKVEQYINENIGNANNFSNIKINFWYGDYLNALRAFHYVSIIYWEAKDI